MNNIMFIIRAGAIRYYVTQDMLYIECAQSIYKTFNIYIYCERGD